MEDTEDVLYAYGNCTPKYLLTRSFQLDVLCEIIILGLMYEDHCYIKAARRAVARSIIFSYVFSNREQYAVNRKKQDSADCTAQSSS
jgi:hypothetical protein